MPPLSFYYVYIYLHPLYITVLSLGKESNVTDINGSTFFKAHFSLLSLFYCLSISLAAGRGQLRIRLALSGFGQTKVRFYGLMGAN